MDLSPSPSGQASAIADPERLQALRDTGLLDSPPDPLFDRLTALTARLLQVPTALVSLVDLDRQFFKSAFGLAEPWRSRRQTPLSHSFCRLLVGGQSVLEVSDARLDARVKDNPAIPDLGVIAYLGVPLHDPLGQPLGALCAIDGQPHRWSPSELASLRELALLVESAIQERVNQRQLAGRLRVFEVLLERIPNASLVLFDRSLRYVLVRGVHLFGQLGLSPQSFEGRQAQDALSPENRDQMLPLFHRALAGEETRLTVKARGRSYDVQIAPARDDRGEIVGGISISHDVTDLAVSERTLQEHTAWLESVLEAMDDVVVVMDREARIVLANDRGRRLVGAWPNASAWPAGSGFFLADQKTPYPLEHLPGAEALRGSRVREREIFLRSPTEPGLGRWQSINASPLRDSQGEISGAVVVSRDITVLREASMEILKQNRNSSLLHQVAAAANQSSDVERALRQALTAITETTGWPVAHVYLRRGDRLVSTELWVGARREGYAPLIDASRTSAPEQREALIERVAHEGRIHFAPDLAKEIDPSRVLALRAGGLAAGVLAPVKIEGRTAAVVELFLPEGMAGPDEDFLPVLDDAISTLGRVFERVQARAALEQHSEQLQALSLIDDLTGLYNRRGFLTLAEQQRRAGQRSRVHHHLIFLDLDGMKGINDQLGHAQGDVALKDTAQLLRSVFRESDILARLGGDEFVIFAASGSVDGDGPILSRVREALRAYNAAGGRPFKLEMSLGSTPCDPERPTTIEELLRVADALMYEQKRQRKGLPPAS